MKYASQIYGIMALRRGIAKTNHMKGDVARAVIQSDSDGKTRPEWDRLRRQKQQDSSARWMPLEE